MQTVVEWNIQLQSTCTDQRDDCSGSVSGDSESDEDCADDRIDFHMVMSTRAGRLEEKECSPAE